MIYFIFIALFVVAGYVKATCGPLPAQTTPAVGGQCPGTAAFVDTTAPYEYTVPTGQELCWVYVKSGYNCILVLHPFQPCYQLQKLNNGKSLVTFSGSKNCGKIDKVSFYTTSTTPTPTPAPTTTVAPTPTPTPTPSCCQPGGAGRSNSFHLINPENVFIISGITTPEACCANCVNNPLCIQWAVISGSNQCFNYQNTANSQVCTGSTTTINESGSIRCTGEGCALGSTGKRMYVDSEPVQHENALAILTGMQ